MGEGAVVLPFRRPVKREALLCRFCGHDSGYFCDGPSPKGDRETCDAPMCSECRRSVGAAKDFCPDCVRSFVWEAL